MTGRPQGQRVVVVGASSSIGRGVVDRFIAEGDHVDATFHSSDAPARAARAGVAWSSLDVTSAASRTAFVERLRRDGIAVDVLVIVTGLLPGKALADYTPELAERCMQVNATGPMLLVGDMLPLLAEGSRVLMFASVSGERGSFDPIYAAAKGAVISFVKSMATWTAPRTLFTALAPGLVEDSAMFEAMAPERREVHRSNTPAGRLVDVASLAAVAHDLTRPHWAHANGSCVRFNGGAYV